MTRSALEIVQQFQSSLGAGTDDWRALLSDDIQFTGPVEAVSGKAAFIEVNNNFMPMVAGYKSISVVPSSNAVVLEGVYSVNTPTGKTIDLKTAEIYETQDGKIQHVRIYYDAQEFRSEFGM